VQTPISIGTLRLPHRVLMGSMHLNLETAHPDALAAFYTRRVRGGAGLIVTGGAAVNRVGAGSAGYTLINEPEHAERWRRVVDAVHAEGGLIALQLFHAGRYALESAFGLRPVAPSPVFSRFSGSEPQALSEQGIRSTIDDFASAATVAMELGFDGVEVMGSEGYLINQFASPVTNLRDDDWGGDAERRRAFPIAVTTAVRRAVGDAPVLVRMSGADLVPGSPPQAEIDALAVALVGAGADAIDVGIGWHESKVPTVQSLVPHGVWRDAGARIKAALAAAGAAVPVVTSNRINSLAQAEEILASGAADLVSMARPFLADPHIIAKSFAGATAFVNTCIGCNEACIDRSFGLEPVSCTVNPTAGHEYEFPSVDVLSNASHASPSSRDADAPNDRFSPSDGASAERGRNGAIARPDAHRSRGADARRVAVVGAGPAGMEAARALAERGARVTLFDSGERIGGQFLMAGAVPGKADFLQTVRYFENELARLGVDVRLHASVNAAHELAGYDHVVVSTGVRPRRVTVPGSDFGHVIDYAQAFAEPAAVGPRVAVLGAGGIAVDLAHLLVDAAVLRAQTEVEQRQRFLAEHGLLDGAVPSAARTVTIMRRSGSIGAGMGLTTRWAAVQAIRTAGVRTLTGVAYRRIDERGVWIERDGTDELIEADTVIVAAGQEPHADLAVSLTAAGIPHTVVGGALSAAGLNAVAAFEQGLRAAAAIVAGAA